MRWGVGLILASAAATGNAAPALALDAFKEFAAAAGGASTHYLASDDSAWGWSASTPITLSAYHDLFSIAATSSYFHYVHKDKATSTKSSLHGLSDTGVTFLTNPRPIDIFGTPYLLSVSVDLNIPTGQTNLSRTDVNSIQSPFLVPQGNLGAGFNIGSGLSVTRNVTRYDAVGLGVSFISRGKYKPFSGGQHYRPGDRYVANAQYIHNDRYVSFKAGVRGIYEADTVYEGQFKLDDRFSFDVESEGTIQFTPEWAIGGSAAYLNQGPSYQSVLNATAASSVSVDPVHLLRIAPRATYTIDERSHLNLSAGFEKQWGTTSPALFTLSKSERDKYSASVAHRYSISETVSVATSLSGFAVDETVKGGGATDWWGWSVGIRFRQALR